MPGLPLNRMAEDASGAGTEVKAPLRQRDLRRRNIPLSLQSDSHQLDQVAELALSWIEYDVRPRVILDSSLFIIWANAAARAALARQRDIENRGGLFATCNSHHQAELGNFITSSGASLSSWHMPRSKGDGHLLIRAQRIAWAGEGIFGVTFHGSGSDYSERYANLDSVFGLTKSEHKVLTDLLDGHEVERLAKLHGVSVETTRSHVRSIYSKLGVSSREALFHKVRPFRL
jgi:DNA-binding CsgD family transcriptional regulator